MNSREDKLICSSGESEHFPRQFICFVPCENALYRAQRLLGWKILIWATLKICNTRFEQWDIWIGKNSTSIPFFLEISFMNTQIMQGKKQNGDYVYTNCLSKVSWNRLQKSSLQFRLNNNQENGFQKWSRESREINKEIQILTGWLKR